MNPVVKNLCKRFLQSEIGGKLCPYLYLAALLAFCIFGVIFIVLWEGSQP